MVGGRQLIAECARDQPMMNIGIYIGVRACVLMNLTNVTRQEGRVFFFSASGSSLAWFMLAVNFSS